MTPKETILPAGTCRQQSKHLRVMGGAMGTTLWQTWRLLRQHLLAAWRWTRLIERSCLTSGRRQSGKKNTPGGWPVGCCRERAAWHLMAPSATSLPDQGGSQASVQLQAQGNVTGPICCGSEAPRLRHAESRPAINAQQYRPRRAATFIPSHTWIICLAIQRQHHSLLVHAGPSLGRLSTSSRSETRKPRRCR